MKKEYVKPICEEILIYTSQILAMSGYGNDSDDSEFVAPAKASRRGEWGNLWQ